MKKVILGAIVLMMAVSLTGCGKTKQEKAVDNFTKELNKTVENLDDEMTKEMKKMGEEIKKGEEETKKEVENMKKKGVKMKNSGKEKSAVEKLKETKELKNCLTKAATQSDAFDCYRALDGENFQNSDAAAMNLGINEWTSADKQKSLDQTDMMINMIQMQVNN